MDIRVTGLNHTRAPVELREKLAVDPKAMPAALAELQHALSARELVILSTCNRVEIYSVHEEEVPDSARVSAALSGRHGIPEERLAPVLYHHQGADAVQHLFRVASSLDSMVLGETQIIAQVKDAYLAAQAAGATGRVFNRLFQQALAVAKRVHTSTRLGEKNVSVPSVASRLAEKIFQDLSRKSVAILGAGEMGELTLQAFRDRGVRRIHVVNRTLENARALAEPVGGEAHLLEEIPRVLPKADIVIACIRSDGYVLGVEAVEQALRMRGQEPMFLIDIAVPRNVHPEINELDNVYLYNVDNLQEIVQQNVLDRERELAKAVPILEEEGAAFWKGLTPPDAAVLLAKIRERLHGLAEEEARRTLGKLDGLSDAQKEEVRELSRRLANKLLHPPSELLRNSGVETLSRQFLDLVRKLFGING
jgi:glutamyl-tRNA reductase